MARAVALALALALATGVPAGAAPAQSGGALPGGGTYVLRPDQEASTAAIALWFSAPSDGYDASLPGVAQLAAAACAAAPLAGGKSLADLVRSLGGRLALSAEPDMVAIDISVPAGSARRALAAATAAFFAPAVGDAAYRLALRDTAVHAAEHRYSFEGSLRDAVVAKMFSAGPASVPSLPATADALAAIPQSAVAAYAARAFRASNAFLALTGAVDASLLDAVAPGAARTGAMPAPRDSTLAATPGESTVEGVSPGIGLGYAGPPIADERAATALDLITDYLFDPDRGVVSRALAGTDVRLTGRFLTYHDPGITIVELGGSGAEAALPKVTAAIAALAAPLDGARFEAARRAFVYRSARGWSTPETLADDLAWYALQGDAGYAPGSAEGAYARAAASLDPSFVAGVARRYLRAPVVVRMVVAKGAAT